MSDLSEIKSLLKGIDARLTILEGSHGKKDAGRNVDTGAAPARVSGAPHKATRSKEPKQHGRSSPRDTREESREDIKPERGASHEAALNSGVDAAVSSYRPPDAPTGPPSRDSEEKLIWDVDDVIPCQSCKEPVYYVRKKLTTRTKISELKDALDPYSDKVPKLNDQTPVKSVGGVAFNCPICIKPMSVIVA